MSHDRNHERLARKRDEISADEELGRALDAAADAEDGQNAAEDESFDSFLERFPAPAAEKRRGG
jgi:hypothetical protein